MNLRVLEIFLVLLFGGSILAQNPAPSRASTAHADERLVKPCLYSAEHKQFNFWIGEWNVQNARGQPVGTSRIELIENGCIILENWDDGPG